MIILQNINCPNNKSHFVKFVKSASISWSHGSVFVLSVKTKYGEITGYYETTLSAKRYFAKRYFKGGRWKEETKKV